MTEDPTPLISQQDIETLQAAAIYEHLPEHLNGLLDRIAKLRAALEQMLTVRDARSARRLAEETLRDLRD